MMTTGVTETKLIESFYFDKSKISEEYLNLKELFDKSRDAISIIENEKYIYCNQSALDLFGIKTKNTYLNSHPSFFSPDSQIDGRNSYEKANKMITIALKKGNHCFEWLHTSSNGERFYVEVLLTKISNSSDKRVLYSVCRDITKRKESEIKLRQREERFRNLFENSLEITCITDQNGCIEFITPAVTKLMGYEMTELIDQNIFNYIHPDNQKEAHDGFDHRFKEGEKEEYKIYRVKTKSGIYKHLRMITSNHLNDPSINGFVINAHDVSELIKAEKEKYIAIFDTKENERNRISHDLHDGLGQTIAAAKMHLNYLDHELSKQIDNETYATFKTALNLVNEATKETRIISHNFMPRSLKRYGLQDATTNLLKQYKKINKEIQLDLISNFKNCRFEERVELAIFRIIQELVSNALKHSKATMINVILDIFEDKLFLEVHDNGIGFDINKVEEDKKKGIGLTGLKQRVITLDGKLAIKSNKDKGSSISIMVKI